MIKQNNFANAGLDRAASRRRDESWIQSRLADPTSFIIPVWNLQLALTTDATPRAIFLSATEFSRVSDLNAEAVFLGIHEDRAFFAVDVSVLTEDQAKAALDGRGEFRELRTLGALLDQHEAGLLAYSRGMVYWHSRHRFCGVCGSPALSKEAGHFRLCSNSACGAEHFPRTDPAVIVLVTHGDRCLLGRQESWVENLYSTLAGFVEPGESLEDAVAREVMEESGVRIRDLSYHSSQPWPFPASLMLGFNAEAESEEIHPNLDELAEVRWFAREEIKRRVKAGTMRLSNPASIAYRLVTEWLEGS